MTFPLQGTRPSSLPRDRRLLFCPLVLVSRALPPSAVCGAFFPFVNRSHRSLCIYTHRFYMSSCRCLLSVSLTSLKHHSECPYYYYYHSSAKVSLINFRQWLLGQAPAPRRCLRAEPAEEPAPLRLPPKGTSKQLFFIALIYKIMWKKRNDR